MTVNRNQSRVLGEGRSMTCAVATQDYIYCRAGSIWITQDGDPKDVVLGPGDLFRAAPVVLSALEASAFSIESRNCRSAPGSENSLRGQDRVPATHWVGV